MIGSYRSSTVLILAAALALGACGKSASEVETLDRELIGNEAAAAQDDPALTAALEDQIMVDPALAQQANAHGVRPADAPAQAPIPPGPNDDAGADRPTLGERARMQGQRNADAPDCYAKLDYSHGWANRLPAGVPLYPDAAMTEAAGNDLPGCRTRIVSFTTAAPLAKLVNFYVAQARRAGYAAAHELRDGEHVVAGDRPGDRSAFFLTISPGAGGSAVDIVANNGR